MFFALHCVTFLCVYREARDEWGSVISAGIYKEVIKAPRGVLIYSAAASDVTLICWLRDTNKGEALLLFVQQEACHVARLEQHQCFFLLLSSH